MDDEITPKRALVPLARSLGLPAGFAGLSATEKLNTILDLPDPGRVVRHLRPDELYALVREIGIEDAWILVLQGTPEQRRAIRDLEVWADGHYEPERLDRILDLSLQEGLEHGIEVVRDSDPEMVALHVFGQARVTLVREEEESLPRREQGQGEDSEEGEGQEATFLSPDGVFWVHCGDPDRVPSVRRLLDLMYAEGVEFAHRILFAGMYDTPSSLEAQALHFRDKRLEDLGFPPPEERFAIWEPFDVRGLKDLLAQHGTLPSGPREDVETRPLALVLAGQKAPLLFWEALAAAADDPALPTLVHRLLYLVNAVLAAKTQTFHNDEAWEEAAAHTIALVSLGIEDLCEGDRTRAREILLSVHPKYLYRVGVEVLRPLNLIARKVLREVGGMGRLVILGEARSDAVRAALRFPPEPPGPSSDMWTLAEARRARQDLSDTLAVLRFLRSHLGFAPTGTRPETSLLVSPTLANVLSTAWARQVLCGQADIEPLTGQEVRDLLVAAFEGGRVRPSLKALNLPESLSSDEARAVQAFVAEALSRVEEALGRLDPGQPVDVRFLGDCLLLREGSGRRSG